VGGEQYGLGETVRALRRVREQPASEELITISAADPVNLVGIITPHAKVPSTAHHRITYWNGVPLAARQGGEFRALGEIPEELLPRVEEALGVRASSNISFEEPRASSNFTT